MVLEVQVRAVLVRGHGPAEESRVQDGAEEILEVEQKATRSQGELRKRGARR